VTATGRQWQWQRWRRDGADRRWKVSQGDGDSEAERREELRVRSSTLDKPRGASPRRDYEDGIISTYYFMVYIDISLPANPRILSTVCFNTQPQL